MTATRVAPEEMARLALDVFPRLMRIVAAAAQETGAGAPGSLGMTQFRVLKRLAARPWLGTELAQELRVTPPTVSAAIDSLVRKGFVERGETPDDRRVVPLQLTEDGRLFFGEMQAKLCDSLVPLLGQLRPEDISALEQGLVALARVLATHPASHHSPDERVTDRVASRD